MNLYFLNDAHIQRNIVFPKPLKATGCSWSRPLSIGVIAMIVGLLHIAVFVWYLNKPYTKPTTEAKILPTIDIALTASNFGDDVKKELLPQPVKPEAKITPQKYKPKLKPTPKLVKQLALKPESLKPKTNPVASTQPKPALIEPPAATVTQVAKASAPNINEGQANKASAPSQVGLVKANYLYNPKPPYPAVAEENDWEGTVILRVQVNPQGFSNQVLVKRSSGHDLLDEAAINTVKKSWRFTPAKHGDTPISSWVTVPIEFGS